MHVVRMLALPRVGHVDGVASSHASWFKQDDNVHRLRLLVYGLNCTWSTDRSKKTVACR
jgi:hypothetical protein